MSGIYDISGGDGALRWLNLFSRLQSPAQTRLSSTFPAASLTPGAGTATAAAGGGGSPLLSVADSAGLVRNSLSAGSTILGYLSTLRDVATQAQYPQYSAELGARAATASSRVNLQATADNLLAAIDRAAGSAGTGGLSLLDGSRNSLALSTTALGGRLAASAQPLTTAALGISSLDLGSDAGIADALARVQSALGTAQQRYQNIQALDQLYRDQSSYLSGVATALAQSEGGRLSQLSGLGNTGYGSTSAESGSTRGLAVNITA
jgi:hypothetical protein